MQNRNYVPNNFRPKNAPYKFTVSRVLSLIILCAAVFYANYLSNRSFAAAFLQSYQMPDTALLITLTIFIALLQVGIFELLSRILFSHVSRKTGYKAFTCEKGQFVDILRWFYIIRCAILGSAFLFVYFFNFLLPLANLLFKFVISVISYYVFFIWLKKLNCLNKAVIHKTFLNFAVLVVLFYGLFMILEFFYWI